MLRIGPAGWAYKDWNGIVYPAGLKSPEQLTFLAVYFDTVEINTSFYNPIAAATAEKWSEQVASNPRFRFTAKIWKAVTHDRAPDQQRDNIIREGFAPLLAANQLGALLLQFPSSFHHSSENVAYVASLRDRFRDFPLVLEVRHNSWNQPGILETLEDLEIGICNIDQPLFRNSLAPGIRTSGLIGYVRLHGRNYQNWWKENHHAGERYDYLYSIDELDPWIDRIRTIDLRANDTYVIANNHYLGKAVVNAVELISVITGEPAAAPEPLIEHYPELAEFAKGTGVEGKQQLGLDFG